LRELEEKEIEGCVRERDGEGEGVIQRKKVREKVTGSVRESV
jgi:hypothetical protein